MKNKENMFADIQKYAIPSVRIAENELGMISQCLARAADRIEKLETALKYIAKHGRPVGIVDKVAKEALKNP